jgi:hypothetical protein
MAACTLDSHPAAFAGQSGDSCFFPIGLCNPQDREETLFLCSDDLL